MLTLSLFSIPFAVVIGNPYVGDALNLYKNQLSGEIPPEIGLLTNLSKWCNLADCLPFFFG